MPCHPDVSTAFPGPIAWCPDVAGAWHGDHFDLGRWRSNFDVQIEIDPGDSRCAQRRQSTQCNDMRLNISKPSLGCELIMFVFYNTTPQRQESSNSTGPHYKKRLRLYHGEYATVLPSSFPW